jgi:hypothetical protein
LREAGSCRLLRSTARLELADLSRAEAAKLQPEFDEAGKIVSFHSRAEQL